MMDPKHLSFLNGLIGTPYKKGGSNRKGIDCFHLARLLQRRIYRTKVPKIVYPELSTRAMAEAILHHPERKMWEEVQAWEADDGMLVLMGNVKNRDFHLGTLVVPQVAPMVVHVDGHEGVGVVADDLASLQSIGYNYLKFYRRSQPQQLVHAQA